MQRDYPGMAGAALFVVVGLLALHYSREFSPLGSVFPRTVGAVMVVLAVVFIAVAWVRPLAPRLPEVGSLWRRIALAATMLGWALLLEPLGFLTTSIICYALLLVISNYDRWTPRMAVAYAAVGAAMLGGLYWVFRFALQVPLPQGVLL